tara:strand:- start:159 stop:284 length:126 start_codon:yes stop_codon:yes gene_type:complete
MGSLDERGFTNTIRKLLSLGFGRQNCRFRRFISVALTVSGR